MWKHLGFKHSPYDTTPLNATKADVELLVGRGQESVDFVTTIESSSNGVTIISGVPGVGKTSFLNVNQYLLESGEAKFGPQLLAARRLCPAQPKDDAKVLALRALHALIENVKIYCEIHNVDQPSQVEEINSWLSGKNKGFSAGVSIAGFGANFGRQVTLPPINNATFEALRDSIECIVSEIVSTLGLKGFFIIIDNLEFRES